MGRKCSRAAGASSVGAEQRERPEGSRQGAGRNIGKHHPPTACLPGCLVLAALGTQPGGESSRRSSQEGKEKTCCWVGACLHTELAPGIKLISGGTSNNCPGWPKVRVPHSWDSDRGQSKCPWMVCDLRKHTGTTPHVPSQLAVACGFQAQERQLHARTFQGFLCHQSALCPLKPLATSALPHPTLTYRVRTHILLPGRL